MSNKIPNIGPSDYRSLAGIGKRGAAKPTKQVDPEEAKREPIRDLVDIAGAKKIDASVTEPDLTPEELARFVDMAMSAPDVRSDEIARVVNDIERGAHGEEALRTTAEGIGQDLGILPSE